MRAPTPLSAWLLRSLRRFGEAEETSRRRDYKTAARYTRSCCASTLTHSTMPACTASGSCIITASAEIQERLVFYDFSAHTSHLLEDALHTRAPKYVFVRLDCRFLDLILSSSIIYGSISAWPKVTCKQRLDFDASSLIIQNYRADVEKRLAKGPKLGSPGPIRRKEKLGRRAGSTGLEGLC